MNKDNLEAQANEAFYKWEQKLFNGESPLSDYDRDIFVTGYVMGRLKDEEEV